MTGRGGVANNTDLKPDCWYRNVGQRGGIYDDPGRSGSSPIRSFIAFVRFAITVRL
jgi:hypothetical protein